jgi:Doublesex dimerisation domain
MKIHSLFNSILCDHSEEKKMLFDCSSELLKKFRYPWEMMPIMYALSKFANGNLDDVMQRIEEGTEQELCLP